MRKLLLLLSILPILATVMAAQLVGLRGLRKARQTTLSLSLQQIVEKFISLGVAAEFSKFSWAGIPVNRKGVAILSMDLKSSCETELVARELLKLGLAEVWKIHPDIVKWRLKVLKLSYILPPFAIIASVMALVVGRIPAGWAFVVIGLMVAVSCALLWFSKSVEVAAAKEIIYRLERARILPRLSEEEALISAIHAWTWVHLLPGMAIPIAMRRNRTKQPSR